MVTWSYSSIKTFDQCPKKYYHLKIARDVKDQGSEASIYGQDVHKAAEDHVKSDVPIPAKYRYMEPILASLKRLDGEKHCELKLALRKVDGGYEPCGFFDNGVWWRGIADLVVINGPKARLVDYKTGKNARYADPKQLDLLAGAIFVHFPEVEEVKSALAYVVSGDLITKEHNCTDRDTYLSVFDAELERLEAAEQSGVFNPISGPLCGWCPVTECPHHKPRRW